MEREVIETIFSNLKALSERSAHKKELLDKNIKAISEPDGSIPEKYGKALEKLNNEIASLQSQVDSGEEVMLKVAEAYIKENAMGNLVFEADNKGTKYFEDVYCELFDENFSLISAALNVFDLEKIDNIVHKMRSVFIEKTFDKYREYSKTLSYNR